MSQPYKWLLKIDPKAQHKFNSLTNSSKRAVFHRLRELLTDEDPYMLPLVEMLQAKKFDHVRKFRVGDFRVFFIIESGEVIEMKHRYKGKLYVLDIRDRKEAY